jgi:hypothetical protein
MVALKKKTIVLIGFVYALCGSIICAIFGFFTIRSLIVAIPLYLCLVSVASITFLGIILQVYSQAFQINEMAKWLKRHPLGQEVLDEFTIKTEKLSTATLTDKE